MHIKYESSSIFIYFIIFIIDYFMMHTIKQWNCISPILQYTQGPINCFVLSGLHVHRAGSAFCIHGHRHKCNAMVLQSRSLQNFGDYEKQEKKNETWDRIPSSIKRASDTGLKARIRNGLHNSPRKVIAHGYKVNAG